MASVHTVVSLDDFKDKDISHIPFVEKVESNERKSVIQKVQEGEEKAEKVIEEIKKDITCMGHVIMSICRCFRRCWTGSLHSCECCCLSCSHCCLSASECCKGCTNCLKTIDFDDKN